MTKEDWKVLRSIAWSTFKYGSLAIIGFSAFVALCFSIIHFFGGFGAVFLSLLVIFIAAVGVRFANWRESQL